jgi:tetratricopeptide (TPR) repeat protein
MMQEQNGKNQLLYYLSKYEENPQSQVFARLADEYRKMGRVDNALKILQKELKKHTKYAFAHYVLAACYFDMGKVLMGYETLKPWVLDNIENISMLKLYANIYDQLEYQEEALKCYNNLIFLNPKDELARERIKQLETQLFATSIKTSIQNQEKQEEKEEQNSTFARSEEKFQQKTTRGLESDWQEKRFLYSSSDIIQHQQKKQQALSESQTAELPDEDFSDWSSEAPEVPRESPEISLALVNLYEKHGDWERALKTLEKFHLLHPKNADILARMRQVEMKMQGHLAHQKIQANLKRKKVASKYQAFLNKVKERANQEGTPYEKSS